jgi:nucleotide-binding universal stress UspA family protein
MGSIADFTAATPSAVRVRVLATREVNRRGALRSPRWIANRIGTAGAQDDAEADERGGFSMPDELIPLPGSVICGVDGTQSATGAIRVARELSTLLGRRLVFVSVLEPGTSPDEVDAAAERLRRLADTSGGLWLVDVGHPADRLVAAAEDEQASLLVLGSHGLRSSLLGSISADVSRRAPCPVVVVPPGADLDLNGGRSTESVGGIARFRLGASDTETDFAGGIARFDLAAATSSKRS